MTVIKGHAQAVIIGCGVVGCSNFKKSVAMGYAPAALAEIDGLFAVLGEMRPATIQLHPLVDPNGGRMKS